jgi:hypothetical protein
MATYYHHFLSHGCELAGCDAPDGRYDLYPIESERRAVRACCGDHARACADLDRWLDARDAEALLPEPEPALDAYDAWARCEACGELAEPAELAEGEGRCARCVRESEREARRSGPET